MDAPSRPAWGSILLIGGARSGKSGAGQALVASTGAPVSVIVTAEAFDDEMAERIDRHRADRPAGWVTIEAPHHLERALDGIPEDHALLLDCLTLWVSNRLLADPATDSIEAGARAVARRLAERPGPTVVIGNEVGQGIVPADPLSRTFRDVHGRVNQILAAELEQTYLVVAGRLVPTVDPSRLISGRPVVSDEHRSGRDRVTPHRLLEASCRATPGPDLAAAEAAANRVAQVLRPAGALARLDAVAVWLAGWQRRPRPAVERPAVLIFGGDHGVTVHGVSAYPAEVTKAMALAIEGSMATSSALAAAAGAELRFFDVGIGEPTEDFTTTDALSPERFAAAWNAGREAAAATETDLLVLGELGIGNTTSAAAIAAALFGGISLGGVAADGAPGGSAGVAATIDAWIGRGTGIDDAGFERKRRVVQAGLERLARGPSAGRAPLEILRRVGGTELAAMAGAAVEARRRSIPVLLDGFIATAALAPLELALPGALDHVLAGHRSAEPGHRRLLEALGKEPLLDLDLRLGEASGALVALPVVRAAAVALSNVATFDEAGVAGPV